MQISNNDGNVLLLNAHIADGLKDAIKLPSDANVLDRNHLAKFLFDISSELPDVLVGEAQKAGFSVNEGAKGIRRQPSDGPRRWPGCRCRGARRSRDSRRAPNRAPVLRGQRPRRRC